MTMVYVEPHAGQPVLAVGTVSTLGATYPAKVVLGKDGFPHVLRNNKYDGTGIWMMTSQRTADSFQVDPESVSPEPGYKALYENLRARIEEEIRTADEHWCHDGFTDGKCVSVYFLTKILKEA